MADHRHVTRKKGPPGISSWTRLRLGWLDERRVEVVPPGAVEEGQRLVGDAADDAGLDGMR